VADQPEVSWLNLEATEDILHRMGDLSSKVVLVGGQAVNYWAERYQAQDEDLRARAPYTSKDIDFCGTRKDVEECARRLGGRALVPTDEHQATNSGAVIFRDVSGAERQIDFLIAPFGLDALDTDDTAIPALIRGDKSLAFRVMHAERCLESRVHNFVGLEQYFNSHGAKQLAASIICARRFSAEILSDDRLEERKRVRAALGLNERIFELCVGRRGLELYRRVMLREGPTESFDKTALDPFLAILQSPSLPDAFARERFPRMVEVLSRARKKCLGV
jgi:hypothetical protein